MEYQVLRCCSVRVEELVEVDSVIVECATSTAWCIVVVALNTRVDQRSNNKMPCVWLLMQLIYVGNDIQIYGCWVYHPVQICLEISIGMNVCDMIVVRLQVVLIHFSDH
jgi:hypothetical protein